MKHSSLCFQASGFGFHVKCTAVSSCGGSGGHRKCAAVSPGGRSPTPEIQMCGSQNLFQMLEAWKGLLSMAVTPGSPLASQSNRRSRPSVILSDDGESESACRGRRPVVKYTVA